MDSCLQKYKDPAQRKVSKESRHSPNPCYGLDLLGLRLQQLESWNALKSLEILSNFWEEVRPVTWRWEIARLMVVTRGREVRRKYQLVNSNDLISFSEFKTWQEKQRKIFLSRKFAWESRIKYLPLLAFIRQVIRC